MKLSSKSEQITDTDSDARARLPVQYSTVLYKQVQVLYSTYNNCKQIITAFYLLRVHNANARETARVAENESDRALSLHCPCCLLQPAG
jgi:hypothetical protein